MLRQESITSNSQPTTGTQTPYYDLLPGTTRLINEIHERLDARRVSTTLRHWPVEFSVAPDLSPASRPAAWAG
jgi:hypothetical protein